MLSSFDPTEDGFLISAIQKLNKRYKKCSRRTSIPKWRLPTSPSMRQVYKYSNHKPLSLAPEFRRERNVFTMMRDPRKRIISAYNHDHGKQFWILHRDMSAAEKRRAKKSIKSPLAYSKYPGNRGCMTKMFSGHGCQEVIAVTEKMVMDAKDVFNDRIAFVGITDLWGRACSFFGRCLGAKCAVKI